MGGLMDRGLKLSPCSSPSKYEPGWVWPIPASSRLEMFTHQSSKNHYNHQFALNQKLVRSMRNQPARVRIFISRPPADKTLTFILQAVLKVAIRTPFTFALVNKIKTNPPHVLFPCFRVVQKVAFFSTWTRPRRHKFKTQFITISSSLFLPFLGDIITPILCVINTVSWSLCCLISGSCLFNNFIRKYGSIRWLQGNLSRRHCTCWNGRTGMNKFLRSRTKNQLLQNA